MFYYRIKEVIHHTNRKSHFFIEYKRHWWSRNWKLFPVLKSFEPNFYAHSMCSTYYDFSIVEHIKHYLEKAEKFKGYNIYPVFIYDRKIYGNAEDFEEQNIFTYQVKWTYFNCDVEDTNANGIKLRVFDNKDKVKEHIMNLLNPITSEIIKIHK